jgi:two-component system NtrC family sensor kinase
MERCVDCEVFTRNRDFDAMQATLKVVNRQFKEFTKIIGDRDRELEGMSMEMALSLSEVLEALKKIASGDPTVRIDERSDIELISKLKHVVNLTAEEISIIVDQSHEFAIVLAELFEVLHKVSRGDLHARVAGKSKVELLESLKKVTNATIKSISKEITRREKAEADIKKAHNKLERRVEERTAELREINEKLWSEIVERKKAEQELREAELRYRTVADFTHDWEYWETPDKQLRYVSPSCERITGYKAADFIGNPNLLSEITVPEDRDIWARHRHEAFQLFNMQDIIFRIRRRDGTICWIEHVCQPVTDPQGNFLGVRAGNRDITIRKQAEEKLRDTLSLLSATLESTADGIIVVDQKGKIVSFNQKFLQLWRIPESVIESYEDDKVLAFVADQLNDPDLFLTKVRELYAHPDMESYDVLEFKDGRVFERYSQPQRIGASIIGRVWSFRDITKRKKAEEALRESEQLLLQSHKMEAIGRLAAGIAHEINNPLAIINEKAGLMKDFLEMSGNLEQKKEKFDDLITGIFESVNRCRNITHRLLGFSRRIDGTSETINLNDTVREVLEFIEKEMLFRNIRLDLHLREDIPTIVSDKGQLQQVFLNIVNNAVDAVGKDGVIEIWTDIKDEHTVTVLIKDTGPGIPQEILRHIFEPFYTTKEKGKGTGLGLSISYGIMQKLGGTILVRSEVNKGTAFTVEIPQKAVPV